MGRQEASPPTMGYQAHIVENPKNRQNENILQLVNTQKT
jgi:hypothetical protein